MIHPVRPLGVAGFYFLILILNRVKVKLILYITCMRDKVIFNKLLPYFEEAHHDYLSRYQLTGKIRSGSRQYVMYKNNPL